ncbi:MAG TPA: N-acetylmuramoyl-L-alanine amidase [Micropepsaceae bacterium]|nr:N-acetylmuramoyl-L-alanine amidase [Micropepsaceae bacterium]
MSIDIIARPSPNHDSRGDRAIDMIVMHYTGMKTAAEAIDRLCDPASRVSAHYVLDEDGTLYQLVPEALRAWHAGVSHWAGESGLNACSIGIEIVNPGHEFGYREFPEAQIARLEELARLIMARHNIPARRIVGHSDIAPARKTDPGEKFPWARLARAGIGLWPDSTFAGQPDRPEILLARIGYGVPPQVDVPLETVITAFQRRFRPARLDGVWDAECGRLAASLAAQIT